MPDSTHRTARNHRYASSRSAPRPAPRGAPRRPSQAQRARARRRRAGRVLSLAVVVALIGLALGTTLSGSRSGRQTGAAGSGSHPTPAPHKPSKPPAGIHTASRGLRVAKVSLTLSEPSTPAAATGHTLSGVPIRVLPTTVTFPVVGPGSGAPVSGPFPLLVFSQGFDESVGAYGGLIQALARAGYVVAAPTYPFTDPASHTELNENDIVNHPTDLRFVIAALGRLAGNPSNRLYGLLDAKLVATVGQSDGGDVSLAVAANSCCRDGAVKAAVILSGAELASLGGAYYGSGSVPLLVAQGSLDTINPPGCSAQLYDQAPQPKYYLDISGAEHLPPYVSPGPLRTGVARTTIAFLNAYLKHLPSGLDALRSTAARLPPQEKLTSAAMAPRPSSAYCPGAP